VVIDVPVDLVEPTYLNTLKTYLVNKIGYAIKSKTMISVAERNRAS